MSEIDDIFGDDIVDPFADENGQGAEAAAARQAPAVDDAKKAIMPDTTPENDPGLPAPKKRGRPRKDAMVTDGPGWVEIRCDVCGTSLGKRPPGHKIDPLLCPNQAVHKALSEVDEAVDNLVPAKLLAKALRAAADVLDP